MKTIALHEIKSFFGSPVGYLVIALFLLFNGLFLWVFDGEYNILQSGFADLSPFFTLSPWIILFLIPAVTIRSFSDEKKQGHNPYQNCEWKVFRSIFINCCCSCTNFNLCICD